VEKAPSPLIRFQGKCAHLWAAGLNKSKTPEECYKSYLEAKREALKSLNDPNKQKSQLEWISYATIVLEMCLGDVLQFRESKHEMDEIFEASELMLDHNILFVNLIQYAFVINYNPAPKPARKLELMDRTLAAIDGPAVRCFGMDKKELKSFLIVLRAKFLEDNPELAGKQGPLPWETAKMLIDLADVPGIREFRYPTVGGADIYVTALGNDPGKGDFIQPVCVPLIDKPYRRLAKMPVIWRRVTGTGRATGISETITGCEVGAKDLYVATRSAGLYAFPLDGSAARRIDDPGKMPSEGVQCMVLYEGRLYAALEGGYLISLDPDSGKFDVLASSRRKDKMSPFDDGEVFIVTSIVADPERRRLLFMLFQGLTQPRSLNGLWTFDIKTREFKHLLETTGVDFAMRCARVGPDHLFVESKVRAVDFDLTRDKHTLLYADPIVVGTPLDPKNALLQQSFRGLPKLSRDGWMWMTSPLSRVSIKEKKQEVLPEPPRKSNSPRGVAESLILIDKDRLLYGTTNGIWLLPLRKE